ncbi:MAG: (2Fe-2S)-binding protein [Desulfitobacteriaceae bacterium]
MIELSMQAKAAPVCPLCKRVGQKVRKVTVEHQVHPDVDISTNFKGEPFFLCRTPECEVAYYAEDSKGIIRQDQLVNKIWFKEVSPPISICYCAKVTEEEILQHVAVVQCCSTLEDIKRHTGANTGCECLTKNPAGG